MWDPEIYLKAINFAAKSHKDQKVPGTEMSYMTHLAQVTQETVWAFLKQNDFDIEYAIQCAMLHDTIEDTPITFGDIEKEFGRKVASGVMALTKNEDLPKEKQLKDSIDRIKKQSLEISIIKIADRIANLKPPPSFWTRERMEKYKDGSIFILQSLKGYNPFLDNRLEMKIEWYSELVEKVFPEKS